VLAAISLLQVFCIRFVGLVDKLADLGMLSIHRSRLSDVYAVQPEPAMLGYGLPEQDDLRGCLELQDLSFRYPGDNRWILRNVNLRVEAGEFVAITGRSGEGKSTLLRILLGLIEVTEGRVLVDGNELRSVGKVRYRDAVGVVLQDDTLFTGSLLENICSFDPAPDMALVDQAARLAGIQEAIKRFPMGYQTLVGDMGSVLSGGQQQRVVLARALYRQPKFLFLDEATSHLDLAKEQEINHEISRLGITRIVVAHRPETVMAAQRVLHLIDGELREISKSSTAETP
jgi:ATP-binding cassette subfamily B protein RaxB